MTTMLERASRAAKDAEVLWNPNIEPLHVCVARAVLMAVREPAADVVQAGMDAQGFTWGVAHSGFTAMIDAILNEGSTK